MIINIIYRHLKNYALYYLIYILFIVEILFNISSKNVLGDESFTLHIIHHNFIDIINLTAQDVHPFLYYFIAKFFTYNVNNTFIQIFILRLVSALPYLILLIISNTYIKHSYSENVAKIFMFCIITMPLLIDDIYQIRMYGWATLFTTICYLLFIYAYNNHNNIKTFIFITIFSLLSSYTHYYSLIIISIIYILFLILFLIEKKKINHLLCSVTIDIFCYLPWMIVLFKQITNVSQNFWSLKLKFSDILNIIIVSLSPIKSLSIIYIFPILLIILLLFVMMNSNIYKSKTSIIGIMVPVFLIIISSLLSFLVGHSVLMDRYMVPSLGIFWLSIAIIIDNSHYKFKSIYSILLLILAIGSISYCKNIIKTVNTINLTSQNLSVFKTLPKNSLIIYNDRSTMASAASYLDNNYLLKNRDSDKTFIVYSEVFNNMNEINSTNIPKKFKNVFYIKINSLQNDSSTNKLIINFDRKYQKKIIKTINIDGREAIIYKIMN